MQAIHTFRTRFHSTVSNNSGEEQIGRRSIFGEKYGVSSTSGNTEDVGKTENWIPLIGILYKTWWLPNLEIPR